MAVFVSLSRYGPEAAQTARKPSSPVFRRLYNDLRRLGSVCTSGGGPGLQNWGKPRRKARLRRGLRLLRVRCLSSACLFRFSDTGGAGGGSHSWASSPAIRPATVPLLSRYCPASVPHCRLPFLLILLWFAATAPLSSRFRRAYCGSRPQVCFARFSRSLQGTRTRTHSLLACCDDESVARGEPRCRDPHHPNR
jgi:hypothetical protein